MHNKNPNRSSVIDRRHTSCLEVAQDMRRVRDEMGRRVFTIKEFLTSKQVASFFSRLAAKKRSVTTSDNEAIEAEEIRKEANVFTRV